MRRAACSNAVQLVMLRNWWLSTSINSWTEVVFNNLDCANSKTAKHTATKALQPSNINTSNIRTEI